VQSEFLNFIGPNDDAAFALTDFDVPVGGAYEVELDLTIAIDHDLNGATPDLTFDFVEYIDQTDHQVVCEVYLDPSSECMASPDAPWIYVYENYTTRIFNDLSNIVTGQMDVFVRDDEADEWLEGATVCLWDVNNMPYMGTADNSCETTDSDGQAEFENVPAGIYSITASAPNHEVDGTGFVLYMPGEDLMYGNSGGGSDDELGDVRDGLNLDYELALDPQATILDIQTAIDGRAALAGGSVDDGVNGVLVNLYIASMPLGTDAAAGVCSSGTLVGGAISDTQDYFGTPTDGLVEFNVDPDQVYCATADVNGDGIPTFFFDIEADVNPQSGANDGLDGDFDEFDVDYDIDIWLNEGGLGVIDVQLLPPDIINVGGLQGGTGPGLNDAPLYFFIADGGDTYGLAGVCVGLFVGMDLTGPEYVDGVLTNGIASLEVDTSQEYCVSIAPDGGFFSGPAPNVGPVSLDPADQDDDIDAELTLPPVP
jgi:hypothetical protein